MSTRTEDEHFSADDLQEIERRATELKSQDRRRYDTVMAEIDKDEETALKRLHDSRTRRAIVKKAGHL